MSFNFYMRNKLSFRIARWLVCSNFIDARQIV